MHAFLCQKIYHDRVNDKAHSRCFPPLTHEILSIVPLLINAHLPQSSLIKKM